MNTKKLISIGKYNAIAVLTLGIIHDIATFTPLIKEGLESLSKEQLNAVTYMSLICGTSLILSGSLLLILLNKLEQFSFLSTPIKVIGGFLCINGILAVIYMPNNPFAWITLVFCLMTFSVSRKLGKIRPSTD